MNITKVRVWRLIKIIFILIFIVSLYTNYQYYRKQRLAHQWRHFSYNWFIAGVVNGAYGLGYGGAASHNPNLAAVSIGEAAMALEQMAAYQDITQTKATPEMRDQYSFQSPPHMEDVEHYLSYASEIMVNPNDALHSGDVTDAEKYILKITQLLFKEAGKNGALSDIPDLKAASIFNQMYNLIPKSITSQDPGGPDQRFSMP